MAKTAVSILTEARASIKKSTWICNELNACTVNKKGAVKHMACAIGIVSLAAGGKAVQKRTQEVVINGIWNGEWLEPKDGGEDETIVLTTYFATYPAEIWSKAAKEAAMFLALAVPEDVGNFDEVLNFAKGNQTQFNYALGSHVTLSGLDPLNGYALREYSDRVTSYNDGSIRSAGEARKWFTQAIKLAKMGRKNALASLESA